MPNPSEQNKLPQVDAAIVGGGIAGAWLLRLLSKRGYRVVLFERDAFGCQQTLASQGMIHGGLKYALGGILTGASEAIAAMPQRWRACMSGNDPMDLSRVRLLSPDYYMFAESGAVGRLTAFFASKALRGRIREVDERPAGFEGFDGTIYRLNDFVVDTAHLLEVLVEDHLDRTFRQQLSISNLHTSDQGYIIETEQGKIAAHHLISCAGSGARQLLEELGVELSTQLRPLKQVMVRTADAPAIFAHCLTGVASNEPRLTITSHPGPDGSMIWYLGGAIATRGVNRTDEAQIEFARQELATCVPWLDFADATFETLDVDRAEPEHLTGLKPDEAYAEKRDRFILCFPTKLTLTPDLGDKVAALLPQPSASGPDIDSSANPVPIGRAPWEEWL